MRFVADTLDDLCRKLYPKLLKGGYETSPTRAPARERVGVILELRQPLARLSRTETRGKPFSSLGELLWYLSRSNSLDFIAHYIPRYEDESEDQETVYGGYGSRFFNQRGEDQIQNVIGLLKASRETRRAVIQIFNAEDISTRHKEVPCTCSLQFLIRRGRLNLVVVMRSNDAYVGLPHDVFCFTMIQEIIARSLGIEMGGYHHFAGSMHLYDYDRESAQQYLDEGVQATVLMPRMPDGDPWPSIAEVLRAEEQIRLGIPISARWEVDPYWADLLRLLQIYKVSGDQSAIDTIKAEMSFSGYGPYVETRKRFSPPRVRAPHQLSFPF